MLFEATRLVELLNKLVFSLAINVTSHEGANYVCILKCLNTISKVFTGFPEPDHEPDPLIACTITI